MLEKDKFTKEEKYIMSKKSRNTQKYNCSEHIYSGGFKAKNLHADQQQEVSLHTLPVIIVPVSTGFLQIVQTADIVGIFVQTLGDLVKHHA